MRLIPNGCVAGSGGNPLASVGVDGTFDRFDNGVDGTDDAMAGVLVPVIITLDDVLLVTVRDDATDGTDGEARDPNNVVLDCCCCCCCAIFCRSTALADDVVRASVTLPLLPRDVALADNGVADECRDDG